jgi:hypothetical protein
MSHFFARLYEWFGIIHFYSKDFGEFMRGWDFACTGYYAIPWYLHIGWLMIISTTVIYGLQFDIISPTRFTKTGHWCLVAFTIFMVNLMLGFIIPFAFILTHTYCMHLNLSLFDCVGFAFSNAIWSFILFCLLNAITPIRAFLVNLRRPVFKKH